MQTALKTSLNIHKLLLENNHSLIRTTYQLPHVKKTDAVSTKADKQNKKKTKMQTELSIGGFFICELSRNICTDQTRNTQLD